MARGRKRLRVGWGMTAVGAALLALLSLSAFCSVAITGPAGWSLGVVWGKLSLEHSDGTQVCGCSVQPTPEARLRWWLSGFPYTISFGIAGFETQSSPGFTFWYWEVPIWAPMTVTFAAGAALLRSGWKTARPTAPLRCSACGYDRSGLPPATPCPECGPRTSAKA